MPKSEELAQTETATPQSPALLSGAILPAAEIRRRAAEFREYLDAIREFVDSVLVEGRDGEGDYGIIPGTKKPTLLQPGADKLLGLFGLTVRYNQITQTEGPEPGRFDVVAEALLYRGDVLLGTATARASSYESKWRYRFGSRVCPSCGKDTIRRSKAEWGGGWYCNAKAGGCGEKFAAGDRRITEQEAGKIQNPDIADVFNTVLQVAQKRAKVAVVRTALRLTDMFTQDVGDPEVPATSDDEPPVTASPATTTTDELPTNRVNLASLRSTLQERGIAQGVATAKAHALFGVRQLADLTIEQAKELLEALEA